MIVVEAMARKKRPDLMALKPAGELVGAVWCAVLALDAPTVLQVAHWCEITPQQANKAIERLRDQGRVTGCGMRPRAGGGAVQTYRVVGA